MVCIKLLTVACLIATASCGLFDSLGGGSDQTAGLGGVLGGAKDLAGGLGGGSDQKPGLGGVLGGAKDLAGGLGGGSEKDGLGGILGDAPKAVGGTVGKAKDILGGATNSLGVGGQGDGGLLGGDGGGILGGLSPLLGNFFKSLSGITGCDQGSIKNLVSLDPSSTIGNLLSGLTGINSKLDKPLDSVLPGLGPILPKVDDALSKILSCVLGLKGLSHVSCDGLPSCGGDQKPEDLDWSNIFHTLGLNKLFGLLHNYESENDVSSLPKDQLEIFKHLKKLLSLFKGKSFPKKNVTGALAHILSIWSVLSESNCAGGGDEISKFFLPKFDGILKKANFETLSSSYKEEITRTVTTVKGCTSVWEKIRGGSD